MPIREKLPTVKNALRLLFPSNCPSCGIESDPDAQVGEFSSAWSENGWCGDCRSQIDSRNSYRCGRCSAILQQPSPYSQGCASCFRQDLPFEFAVSVHNYRGLLQQLVIRAKNKADEPLMAQLGRLLGDRVKEDARFANVDLMVPVPAHWRRRLFSDGFHAPTLIAQNVEKMTGIPQSQRILCAAKPTMKQGTLSRTARMKNVRNAFACKNPRKIAGRNVLLIDDVMTSGATMIEATKTLKNSGAANVYAAVVARATSAD